MLQRTNPFENIHKLAQTLQSKGAIDVILDHDGTMMDSSTAEAKRILAALHNASSGFADLSVEDIKSLGYGKNGVWTKQLLEKIQQRFPAVAKLIDENKTQLTNEIGSDDLNESIIQMGLNLEEIPGTAHFLRTVIDQGNQTAVFSGNWNEVVYVGLNTHLAKFNIACPAPQGKALNEYALQLVQDLAPAHNEYARASIAAFNDSHGQKINRKPNPDGLLMQKFSLLQQRGLVKEENAATFLSDSDYRNSLSKHKEYRQSMYIGDDFVDLKAAVNAGFEHFIAINEAGSEASNQMCEYMQTLTEGTINIIYASNLAEAQRLLFNHTHGLAKTFSHFAHNMQMDSKSSNAATPVVSDDATPIATSRR